MEGGSRMTTQQSKDLKDVDDSVKTLNKKDTQKLHTSLKNDLNKAENKDYLDAIEDILAD